MKRFSEVINELKTGTLISYVDKASNQLPGLVRREVNRKNRENRNPGMSNAGSFEMWLKGDNRRRGLQAAARALARKK